MKRFIASVGAIAPLLAAAAVAFGGTPPTAQPATTQRTQASPSASAAASGLPEVLGVPMLSADQIMINAENRTRTHPKPSFITYQMHEVFVHTGLFHTGQREVFDYRVWYRYDGKGLMQSIHPDRLGRAETFFGYPFPSAPDNDILLYATPDPALTPPPSASPKPLPSGATPPPVISVQPIIGDRYYSVTLAGLEQYNNKPVYHLMLRALRDELSHPWKELWIDAKTFDVWKGYAAESGHKGPAQGSGDGTVEFVQVGQYWLVSNAVGDGEVHLGPLRDSGHYEYTFYNFGFPPSIPEWYFDPKLFKQHH